MNYAELLSSYIDKSGLSLGEIAVRLTGKGINIDRSYISKLKNGNKSPASEDVTRALAEVTGGDPEALLLAGYIEKAPPEVQNPLRAAQRYHIVFMLIKFLVDYLEYYRLNKEINEELYEKVQFAGAEVSRELLFYVDTDQIRAYPELAATLIAQIKRHFLPEQEIVTYASYEINLNKYVNTDGNPIFIDDPYPELIDKAEKAEEERVRNNLSARKEMNVAFNEEAFNKIKDKIQLIEELENILGVDITNPEVSKKLKRAAKIAFIDED